MRQDHSDGATAPGDRGVDAVQLALGSMVTASRWLASHLGNDDGATPSTPRSDDPIFVVLGAAAVLEERVRELAATTARVASAVASPLAPIATGLLPDAVRASIVRAVHRLGERGIEVAAASGGEAARITNALVDDVVNEPLVVRTVEQVVDQVQEHVVDEVLPGVLDRLAREPDQVRVIVQGQSLGVVEEAARTARERLAEGDDAVDRLVARMRRRPRGAP